MSLVENLRKEKMLSMKNKDKLKTGVISLIMSNILLAEKEKKSPLSDSEALTYVQKELKQTEDALEQTPKDRKETIDKTKKKIDIIKSFLPEQMTKDEVKVKIREVIKEQGLEISNCSKGVIIKEMLQRYSGKTDGKMINITVSEVMNEDA